MVHLAGAGIQRLRQLGGHANILTITALREVYGLGEIIVPPLTWVSDIASVLQCGFTPVFVDINPRTLGMDTEQVVAKSRRALKRSSHSRTRI